VGVKLTRGRICVHRETMTQKGAPGVEKKEILTNKGGGGFCYHSRTRENGKLKKAREKEFEVIKEQAEEEVIRHRERSGREGVGQLHSNNRTKRSFGGGGLIDETNLKNQAPLEGTRIGMGVATERNEQWETAAGAIQHHPSLDGGGGMSVVLGRGRKWEQQISGGAPPRDEVKIRRGKTTNLEPV